METLKMKYDIPAWAMRKVTEADPGFVEVRRLHELGRIKIQFPDLKTQKAWAKAHNWPRPWFGFRKAWVNKLFESPETFDLAIKTSGIMIHIPIKAHTITTKKVKKLDELYEEREDMGDLGKRPVCWGSLVSELREIRRLVEAGVPVHVEDTTTVLETWQQFYTWAHGRFSLLEEGSDSWIGDDAS